VGDLAHPWAPRAFGRLRRGQPERFRLIALSAVLAVPASAASSYQVLVAGIDTSADPAQAAVKVRELPGGTPNTIDLGDGAQRAYGVAVHASATEAFATVETDDYTSAEVSPITRPFTFTDGVCNGTVGAPLLTVGGADASFDIDGGIVVSGNVVAVLNDSYGSYGVYLFGYTLSGEGPGSASDPDFASLPFEPIAITANSAGLVAVSGRGGSTGVEAESAPSDGADASLCTASDDYFPGCVWTFSVSPLVDEPAVTTAMLDPSGDNVNCDDSSCDDVYPGIQGIVGSPVNGDIYVTDNYNDGVWQMNSPYGAELRFQWLSGVEQPQAITINTSGNTLYLSDGYDPHAYQVDLSDSEISSSTASELEDLTGNSAEPCQIGTVLSPDGSAALVLDADDCDNVGPSYVDEVQTGSFTNSFSQYDPLFNAGGMAVVPVAGPVLATATSLPITGAGLPIALAAALILAGVAALGASAILRRRVA